MFSHKSLLLLLILFLSLGAKAQEAYKIGETSRIRGDASENPDINWAVEEMKSIPRAKLAIITFGLPGLAIRRMNGIKKYYEMFFKTDGNNLITIYGGYGDSGEPDRKLRGEFWIMPENAEVPKISPTYPTTSFLFDEFYWKKGESGYDFDYPHPLGAFLSFLKKYPQNEAYIIYYGYRDRFFNVSLKESYKQAVKIKRGLIISHIEPAKIKILKGGYSQEWGHLELWIVPSGAMPPKPTSTNKN